MEKLNCWEIMDCGHGPGSEKICPAVTHTLSEGFLDGEKGGRACMFIRGTLCGEDDAEMSISEKLEQYCFNCEFYLKISEEEGVQSNLFYYIKHLHDLAIAQDKLDLLPELTLSMFDREKVKSNS